MRGSLILASCVIGYILMVSVGEYYLYLPVWIRITLVSLFVLLGGIALVTLVAIPLSKMAKLGRIISHDQAATIVGQHFPEISDKLLNILQLKRQSDATSSRELIEASINQKAGQLSVIPITAAVDYSKNRKYLRYLIPLMIVGIVIMVFSPSIFMDASERLLQPTKTFEKPAPFQFILRSNKLQVVRNEDFTVKMNVTGAALPAEMFIEVGGERLPMTSGTGNSFQYTFKNITEPISFRFFAAGFYSGSHTLKVVQKPVLKAFRMQIDYPDYIGRKDETRNSLSDMTLPAGTIVHWGFMAEHTDLATIRFGSAGPITLPSSAMVFAYSARFLNDTSYSIALTNKSSSVTEQYPYHVQVTPDQYPVIQVQEHRDSVTGKQILLSGNAGDDYGISKVLFHYTISNEQNKPLTSKAIPLQGAGGAMASFQHYFDVDMLNLQKGQKLSYYIEAWDNDGVHGPKASRSEVMSYAMYNATQLDSVINATADQISSGLSNSSKQTKQLQAEMRDMKSKMLQSDKMDWEQQESLQNLSEKQQQLQQQLENTKKRFEEQIQQSQQKEYSEDVREKQDALKEQMDNLLNKELQEQMKKLEELMAKLNKENAFQTMQQLEQENKLFNMDLQRMQELMKKLEMQMRMEDMANKMDQLAKEQLSLKQETDAAKKDNASLSKEQDKLQDKLDKAMKEDMKDLSDLNNKMEQQQQQDLSGAQQDGKKADQNMQQSEQQLNQNEKSNSSKSQQQAAQNLQDMANAMREAASGMDMQQIDMDIKAVRQILSNLMRLSFDQEQLMGKVKTTSAASPQYLANQKEQGRLHSNSAMVRDSLFVLSKRIFKLAAAVNKETTELEKNMNLSKNALENRATGEALTRQQFVMTRTNNLALMLNEMLSNLMQMQSQAQQPGSKGSCNKPGGKTPKPGAGQQLGDIISKQKQLGNAMQQAQQAGQKGQGGKQPGGKQGQGQGQGGSGQGLGSQPGEEGSGGEYGSSEQLARMAAQQAAIRRQLQQLQSQLNSKGLGGAKELKEIQDKMDKNETDIVNKRLTSDMIKRQQEILTRLLQTEKALREQDEDDKRSSKNPPDIARPIPAELQRYLKDKQSQTEFYKTIPPQLKPYYKTMVEDYYKMLGGAAN